MSNKEKILLADDVKELASAVETILKRYNYDVDVVYNGKDVVEKVKNKVYNCLILDIMMPIMDGVEAVKEIRKLNIKTPIILLTAKDLVKDKVEGLDSGANDYLTKPFAKEELLARIRALTRVRKEQKETYMVGNILFDKENSEMSKDKISMRLNNKECALMDFLVKNQNRSISEDELKQRVWLEDERSSENIVPMYITYLQEKLFALNANVKINDQNGYSLEKLI